jgi:hypothetical protein
MGDYPDYDEALSFVLLKGKGRAFSNSYGINKHLHLVHKHAGDIGYARENGPDLYIDKKYFDEDLKKGMNR